LFAITSCELIFIVGSPISVSQEPSVFRSRGRKAIPRNRLDDKISNLNKSQCTLEGNPRLYGVMAFDLVCMNKMCVIELI